MKRCITVLVLFVMLFSICGCSSQKVKIYDTNDKLIIDLTTERPADNINNAYIDIVFNEAIEIIMKEKKLSKEDAQKELFSNKYEIYTYADTNKIKSIDTAYEDFGNQVDFGSAITDLNGKLIAAYSNSNQLNFATQKSSPYSTIKPLSVYCQAIENKSINWSTTTLDSPYKKISDATGKFRDWPANSTNKYLLEPVTVQYAIKHSLNTVAVKVLNDYGVKKSIEFLNGNLKLNFETEEYKVNSFGEDEVIGNIALGYTVGGESPIDMAGYYQIFANGGNYSKPTAIKKIIHKTGMMVYEDKSEAVKVISEETSYIMNELLKGVVTAGGTGEKAYCEGVAVAGKTGTGDSNNVNWFVGVTPEYSCAVWHSNYKTNCAAEIFSDIVKNSEIKIKDFRTSPNVVKQIYCKESGKLFSDKCEAVEMGYYTADNLPAVCDIH